MEEKIDKILAIVKRMDEKIDDLIEKVKILESKGPSRSGIAKSPSDIVMEQKLDSKEDTAAGRIKCPKCGSTQYNVMEDKSKPISYTGGMPIYAKKYVCRKCGEEWH